MFAEDVAGVPPWVLLTGQICTLIGAVAAAFLGYRATMHAREGAKEAKEAKDQAAEANVNASQTNDAVNRKHPEADRLFDMVVELRDGTRELMRWKSTWDGLPEHLADADKLTTHFTVLGDRIETSARGIHRRIDSLVRENHQGHEQLTAALADHIDKAAASDAVLTAELERLKRAASGEEGPPL